METKYYIKNGKSFVGEGHYHWITGARLARKFSVEEVKKMVGYILEVTDDREGAVKTIKVVPTTGGFKSKYKVGLE